MLLDDLKAVCLRDLASLERELALYPDDQTLWQEVPGLPNTGGTLLLHLAGNVQHYFGSVVAGSGYVRDRAAEFGSRDRTRHELQAELGAAERAVIAAFERLQPAQLGEAFPVELGGRQLSTAQALLHLSGHLAYHLGQLDYHRRAVTGEPSSAGNLVPPSESGVGKP